MDAIQIRESGFLKHYRHIRKFLARQNNMSELQLELLIYLYYLNRFTRDDFVNAEIGMSWSKRRFLFYTSEDWIRIYRKAIPAKRVKTIYELSPKAKKLVARVYRVAAGEENLPVNRHSPYSDRRKYSNRQYGRVIDRLNKDPDR